MNDGVFEIDGVEYPDADASDPVASGWMQGSPPPPAKLIRFQDDRFLEFPQIRWTLSHMRELAPTAAVWRGAGVPSDLGVAPLGLEASIDARINKVLARLVALKEFKRTPAGNPLPQLTGSRSTGGD